MLNLVSQLGTFGLTENSYTASSYDTQYTYYRPWGAFDGINTSNAWGTRNNVIDQWLKVDFNILKPCITKIIVYPYFFTNTDEAYKRSPKIA